MSLSYVDILNLPERSLLQKKLTKAFFLKNFDLSATEKKVLNSTIVQMEWLASLKPSNCNVPSVINDLVTYEEVQIMICNVGNEKVDEVATNCFQLFQKHIPYNMLVIVENDTEFKLNVCEKRINQNDKTKRTIENQYTSGTISKLYKTELSDAFLTTLDFSKLDKTNLEMLYRGYCNAIVQFNSASVTGVFQARNSARTQDDLVMLNQIEDLERDISKLTNQLKAEKQQNQRVTLNIAIHQKRKQIEDIKIKLSQI
ncbi:DUF4391 domain-containing protein [Cloacibacterium normanense]|nr:DUF4391 domain-containing protein [Cloacibacterium normanense]AZI69443.1 DUF4391 domain-containing protein [Cloacibacterium normanense]SDO20563.1 protein of unknown function [Cloacibacterium normanense]